MIALPKVSQAKVGSSAAVSSNSATAGHSLMGSLLLISRGRPLTALRVPSPRCLLILQATLPAATWHVGKLLAAVLLLLTHGALPLPDWSLP